MARRWLLKTEPSTYSFSDLLRDGKTTWDGIKNAAALLHLRAVRKGDRAFIYHTGSERAVVGIARVTRGAHSDLKAGDPRLVAIGLEAVAAFEMPSLA